MITFTSMNSLAIPSNLPRLWRYLGWSAAFIFGYVFLDWASYFDPLHGLNITPWNPGPALGLVFIIRWGWLGLPPLAIAVFIAEGLVRGLQDAWPMTMMLSLLPAAGYVAIGAILRYRFGEQALFNDRRSLFDWVAIISVGTLLNSLLFVAVLTLSGVIVPDEFTTAFIRFWIGDSVGILVSMPLLWWLSDERGRAEVHAAVLHWETAAYGLLGLGMLWLAFGLGREAAFKYFYLLLLPTAWAASRQGMAGAVVSAATMQVGMIVAAILLGYQTVTVLELQILGLALALMGFFVGVVVEEQHRAASELRQTLRLAAAGEMAAALAHELNQPLTAISAYGSACEQLLDRNASRELLHDAIGRMMSESRRAAEVIRRLRDFFRTGATELQRIRLTDLVHSAAAPFFTRARDAGVEFSICEGAAPVLMADPLQMEVVIRNLLTNAFEAVADNPPERRRVELIVEMDRGGDVGVRIEDSGPGIPPAIASRVFEPFVSSKSSGLGLGLAISRAIVEAHGGRLWAEVGRHGAFRILLPVEEGVHAGG